MGFPGQSIDDLELVEENDDESEEENDDGEDGVEENEDDDDDVAADDDDSDDDAANVDAEEEEEEGEGEEDANEDDDEAEIHLDPRAGRVDVFIAEIPFEPQEIIDIFEEIKYKEFTNVKTRQIISKIVNQ